MQPALLQQLVVDRRQRFTRAAERPRRADRSVPGNARNVRIAVVRQDLGFRLVEAGLRLALGRGQTDQSQLRRSA